MPEKSASPPQSTPASQEETATALWTFIQARHPRFTRDDAVALVRELQPRPGDEPKKLARALQEQLHARGIQLKRVNALQAASRLNQHTGWHANADARRVRLVFAAQYSTTAQDSQVRQQNLAHWEQAAEALCSWADEAAAAGEFTLGVLALLHKSDRILLQAPRIVGLNSSAPHAERHTLCAVLPAEGCDLEKWREGAAGAFERLRRHLEERFIAVVDGMAVLQACEEHGVSQGTCEQQTSISLADLPASELVLLCSDPLAASPAPREVARGDEVGCWHQLELSLRAREAGHSASTTISVQEDAGVGSWLVGGCRFIWKLEALQGHDFAPVRRFIFLDGKACQRLLRRYHLAKKMNPGTFRFHEQVKPLAPMIFGPSTVRVDTKYLVEALARAGLSWEQYCETRGAALALQQELPGDFVMQLLEDLKVPDGQRAFLLPLPEQLVSTNIAGFLRVCATRAVNAGYSLPDDATPDEERRVMELVTKLGVTQRLPNAMAGGIDAQGELPYRQATQYIDELLQGADALGMQVHAAMTPGLQVREAPTRTDIPPAWPWAPCYSLYLRFTRHAPAAA